jgi:tRNA-modifying protein YgfZ
MNSTHHIGPGGACRLPHWGVLRAEGEDSSTFVHAQLSNDVSKQPPNQARWAAYCSAQGRMLASFLVSKRSPSELWLACSADLLAPTLKRLSMFVLRAKTQLSDASSSLAVLGLAGANAQVWLAAQGETMELVAAPEANTWSQAELHGGAVIRLPAADGTLRWMWIGPSAKAETLLQALPALPLPVWQWLEVRSAVVQVVNAITNQLVPQMLNYELVGGVDFKKGCYPGQEVVARSHYLGKLKRRGFLLDSTEEIKAGQEVYWSGDAGQPAGVIALAAPHPGGGWSAMAELKLAVVGSGSLHLGGPEGAALTLVPLPYALPQDAVAPAVPAAPVAPAA